MQTSDLLLLTATHIYQSVEMKQLPIVLFKAVFLWRLKYKTNRSVSISTILPRGHNISTKVIWHIFFCSRHGREDLKNCLHLFSLSFWCAFFLPLDILCFTTANWVVIYTYGITIYSLSLQRCFVKEVFEVRYLASFIPP